MKMILVKVVKIYMPQYILGGWDVFYHRSRVDATENISRLNGFWGKHAYQRIDFSYFIPVFPLAPILGLLYN